MAFKRKDIDVDLFWSKVLIGDACWEWQAGQDEKGYGRFDVNRRSQRARRVAWAIYKGRPAYITGAAVSILEVRKVTKREAKRWACEIAADLLESDMDTCPDLAEDADGSEKKRAAMRELIAELVRRGEG
jgi:hypothetical protein